MSAIDEYYKLSQFVHNADSHLKIAELYLKENDSFSAINALEQAMDAYSDDDRVKDLLAKLCIETGDVNKAEKYAVSDLLKIKIK